MFKMKQIEFEGKLYSLSGLARHLGITRSALEYRMNAGWDLEKIASVPLNNTGGGRKRCMAKHWKECFSCKFGDCIKSPTQRLEGEGREQFRDPKDLW